MKPHVDLFSFFFLEEIEDTEKTFWNQLTFRDFSKSWQYYRLIYWIKTVSSPKGLFFIYNSHYVKAQYQRLKNKS